MFPEKMNSGQVSLHLLVAKVSTQSKPMKRRIAVRMSITRCCARIVEGSPLSFLTLCYRIPEEQLYKLVGQHQVKNQYGKFQQIPGTLRFLGSRGIGTSSSNSNKTIEKRRPVT